MVNWPMKSNEYMSNYFISRKCVHHRARGLIGGTWRNVHVDPTSCARFVPSFLGPNKRQQFSGLFALRWELLSSWSKNTEIISTNPPTQQVERKKKYEASLKFLVAVC